MAISRKFYKDRWNENKVWEVVRMVGAYYLRQYVCGTQVGPGLRTSKKWIASLGILEFQEVAGTGMGV